MYNSGGGNNPQGEKKTNLNGWSKIQELNNVKCCGEKKKRIYAKKLCRYLSVMEKMEQLTMLNIKNKCNKIYVNTI